MMIMHGVGSPSSMLLPLSSSSSSLLCMRIIIRSSSIRTYASLTSLSAGHVHDGSNNSNCNESTMVNHASRRSINCSSIDEHIEKPRIMVTGALGQLGSEFVKVLRNKYGHGNVIATDVRKPKGQVLGAGPFVYADVLNYAQLESLIVDFRITWVVHFSALLSAVGEKNPLRALEVNVNGFHNVIELAKVHALRLLSPSTIGAFGPTTPRDSTPDLTIQRPTTIYGVSKVHMELLGEYYHHKFGVDFRSLRYPGIISAEHEPGGGTTDYAVDIYHAALTSGKYECFLSENTRLPMMYLPDCLRATADFLESPSENLKNRTYNLQAVSFTPSEVTKSIQRHIPNFEISYKPDFRQGIADTWPRSLDDKLARDHWGWSHEYDLDLMTDDMLKRLSPRYIDREK